MRRIAVVVFALALVVTTDLRAQLSPPAAAGVITLRSPWSVPETLSRFERAISERGLTRFALIDHDGAAREAGLTLREAKLLVFGAPAAGTPVMTASPLAALDLPLKLLIWRADDGTVYVSYNAPAYLAQRHALTPELAARLSGIEMLVGAVLESGG